MRETSAAASELVKGGVGPGGDEAGPSGVRAELGRSWGGAGRGRGGARRGGAGPGGVGVGVWVPPRFPAAWECKRDQDPVSKKPAGFVLFFPL